MTGKVTGEDELVEPGARAAGHARGDGVRAHVVVGTVSRVLEVAALLATPTIMQVYCT